MFLMLHSINLPLIGQYMYYNCLLTRCDVIKFEINLIFLIKSFLIHKQKVKTKTLNLENEKSFRGEIKTIFHHF